MLEKIKWPQEFPGAHWIDREESEALRDVIENGSMFRYYGIKASHFVDDYEESARKFYGVKYALGINSGTGALICAMTALDVGPGSEVIVPAFMWVATVGAVVQCGAVPVLCEVDESLNMDLKDLEKKINSRTRLIVPIHMAGVPCDMENLMKIADKHGIPVLEDCAQCNGGSFHGRKVGTFGKMGIFSLQLNKNMTCGEGGLIITDDEKLYLRAFSSHDMGMIRKNGRLAMPEDDAILWGAGRRMNEMCGAVANVQIKKLGAITGKMLASKKRIKKLIGSPDGLRFRHIADPDGDSGPFLIFILDDAETAKKALAVMKEYGLESAWRIADYGLHIYYNIPALVNKVPVSSAGNPWKLEQNKNSVYDYSKGACAQSDDIFERTILLPVPSCLTESQENAAAEIVKYAVKK